MRLAIVRVAGGERVAAADLGGFEGHIRYKWPGVEPKVLKLSR